MQNPDGVSRSIPRRILLFFLLCLPLFLVMLLFALVAAYATSYNTGGLTAAGFLSSFRWLMAWIGGAGICMLLFAVMIESRDADYDGLVIYYGVIILQYLIGSIFEIQGYLRWILAIALVMYLWYKYHKRMKA